MEPRGRRRSRDVRSRAAHGITIAIQTTTTSRSTRTRFWVARGDQPGQLQAGLRRVVARAARGESLRGGPQAAPHTAITTNDYIRVPRPLPARAGELRAAAARLGARRAIRDRIHRLHRVLPGPARRRLQRVATYEMCSPSAEAARWRTSTRARRSIWTGCEEQA